MSECMSAEIRDALPDYLHGHLDAGRTAEVRAHLEECPECAAEVELLRIVVASAPAAPQMNVDRIASALPKPTRHGFLLHRGGGTGSTVTPSVLSPTLAQSSRISSRRWVKVAAALVIVATGGLTLLLGRDVLRPDTQVGQIAPETGARSNSTEPAPTPSLPVPVPPGTRNDVQRTRQVAVASTAGLSLAGELQELSDEHLATLLSEMDRMDGLPAVEPDALEPAVGSDTSGGNR